MAPKLITPDRLDAIARLPDVTEVRTFRTGEARLWIPTCLVGREERTAGSIEVGYPASGRFAPDDTQLLVQLADQRAFGTFVRLDLAAGKLPQPGHLLARRALADQHPPVDIDEWKTRPLLERIARGEPGRVVLAYLDDLSLAIEVQ